MAVQVLTLEDVKAAARKAWDNKRLLAQHIDDDSALPTQMFRTDDGYGCAIGVALNEETIAALRAGGNLSGTIYGMLSRGQIRLSPPGPRTADAITNIMIAHDLIIAKPRTRAHQQRQFLELIDHPSAA